MSMSEYMEGKVKSNIGFYIGDPYHVLNDKEIYGNWEKKYKFDAGDIKTDCGTWFNHSTAYGDKDCHYDNRGVGYKVDSGIIAVIPLEVVFAHPSEEILTDGAVSTDKMNFFGNTVIRNGKELSCTIIIENFIFWITVQMRNEDGVWESIYDTEIYTA